MPVSLDKPFEFVDTTYVKGDSPITSERTWGVEIECDMISSIVARKTVRAFPPSCGISGDGSVRGNYPRELQTAPVCGISFSGGRRMR